jgi:hypothetical protein
MPPEGSRPICVETITPEGVRVVLFEDTWQEHILEDSGHDELSIHLDAVLATVLAPDHREPDVWPHRERFYKQNVGPSRWLKVVVSFERAPARIVTAYGRGHGKPPTGWIPP